MCLHRFVTGILLLAAFFLFTPKLYAQPATTDNDINRDPMIVRPDFIAKMKHAPKNGFEVRTVNHFDNFRLGVDFAECSIAINPLNPLEMYATWNRYSSTKAEQGYRTEDGYNWVESDPEWQGMAGDVVVVSDNEGRLYFQNMFGTTTTASKIATSRDFGRTWDTPVQSVAGNDKPWMSVDPTNGIYSKYLYATMTANLGGNFALSTNGGNTFTTTNNFSEHRLPGMCVCVGPDGGIDGGSVYVVTNSGLSTASVYTFWVSHDGGQTFTMNSSGSFSNFIGTTVNGRNAVENMRTRPYPYIVADNSHGPHRGRLYLVYASNQPAGNGNKPDIFCHYSDDQAVTWSAAKVVNDDTNTLQNHNWFPAVCNDVKTGRLYLSWMDTRDCPTSDSAMIYATYSDDGETFAPNQPVSQKKMVINCIPCGGGGAPAYYGDYNGVASNGKVSVMAWTDFRDNNFGSYVAYFPDFALDVSPLADTLDPEASFNISVPETKLYSDTVIFTASISPNPELFDLVFPQGNILFNFPGSVPIQIKPKADIPTGNYSLEIVATGPNGTPIHKRSVSVASITYVAPIAAFTQSSDSLCAFLPVNFTDISEGPATSWLWTFPGGTPSTSNLRNPQGIVYHEAGIYDVSLSVSNKIGSNSIIKPNAVKIMPAPAVPPTQDVETCFGAPLPTLRASGSNITWYYNSQVAGHDSIYTPLQSSAGEYMFKVTQKVNGCESPQAIAKFTIHPLPVVSFSSPAITCSSNFPFELSGGSPAGGVYTGKGISDGVHFDPSVAGIGSFLLNYTVKDQHGCSDSANAPITVKVSPVIFLDSILPLCANAAPVQLKGAPAGGVFSGAGVTDSLFYPDKAGSGLHSITYNYLDPVSGCNSSDKKYVRVKPLPAVHAADMSMCGNRKITLDATTPDATQYLWSPGGATTSTIEVDTAGRGLGAFTYRVTVTGTNGCTQSDTTIARFFDCTGFDDNNSAGGVSLRPNPNSGIFYLQTGPAFLPGDYRIVISDASGKQVLVKLISISASNNKILVDAGKLPAGNYTLQIIGEKAIFGKKLNIRK